VFDVVLIRPIINVLLLLYRFMGRETILAVTMITLILRLALTPLQLKQQKTMKRQQELRPKMDELQKKYKDEKEKLAQEQMKLYQEAGVNPLGGCLSMVIQLPLMIGLYQAIIRVLAATPLQLLALPADIYRWIPSLSTLVPLRSHFLWLDMALPDPYYVLPVLVVISSWYYQKLLTPPAADPQSAAMSKQMTLMMPLMTGFFAMTYASGLAIYFLISNLVGILQYFLFRQHYQVTPTAPNVVPSVPTGKPKADNRTTNKSPKQAKSKS
jgi:YidC/Oxa1 family membrane protein insertase